MERLLNYAVVPLDIFEHGEDFSFDPEDEWVVMNLRNNSVNPFPVKPKMRDIEDIDVQWTVGDKLNEHTIDAIFEYVKNNPARLENDYIVALVNKRSEDTIVDITNEDLYALGYTFDRYVIRTHSGIDVVIYKNYPASIRKKEMIVKDINDMLKRQSTDIINEVVAQLPDIHKAKKRII